MDNWYVFFVRTGQEEKAARDIMIHFGNDVTYMNLSVEKLFRRYGKVIKEVNLLFPGYVFITSPISNDEFVLQSKDSVRKSKHIIKLLCYGDTKHAVLSKKEQASLECMLRGNHCVEVSKGFIVGDQVVVADGPFIGQESKIKEIRRHKMEAIIEIEFMGNVRQMVVGLEIVEKLK